MRGREGKLPPEVRIKRHGNCTKRGWTSRGRGEEGIGSAEKIRKRRKLQAKKQRKKYSGGAEPEQLGQAKAGGAFSKLAEGKERGKAELANRG